MTFGNAIRLMLLVLFIHTLACNRSGTPRYDLSGNVTFEDQPVPSGAISFDPVEGGIGGGFAEIRDGRFDTATDGRGHLGGEHRVRISGNTGQLIGDDPDLTTLDELFPPYETTVELPIRSTSMDFEIPTAGGR